MDAALLSLNSFAAGITLMTTIYCCGERHSVWAAIGGVAFTANAAFAFARLAEMAQ